MSVIVDQQYPYFFEKDKSRALFNASIYIGDADTDPEFNQKVVVGVQEDGTEVPLNQPLKTNSGGGVTYNGSPIRLKVEPPYSMKVVNSKGVQEYYWACLSTDGSAPTIGSTIQEEVTLSDGQQVIDLALQLNGYISVQINGLDIDNTHLREGDTSNPDDSPCYEQLSPTQLMLSDSYPAGSILTVTQNDLSGDSKGPINCIESQAIAEASSMALGSCFIISGLGGAKFHVVSSDYTLLSGDFEIGNGLKAQMQSDDDGNFSAVWFGLVNDPDDTEGTQLDVFDRAGERADVTKAKVIIPASYDFRLEGDALDYDITWILENNVNIKGVGGVAPTFVFDLTILGGRTEYNLSGNARAMKYYGDGTFRYQKVIERAQTAGLISACATNGSASIMATACTSFSEGSNTIGSSSKTAVDNETTARTGWGGYDETIIVDAAHPDSNGIGREVAICNERATCFDLQPYSIFADATGLAVGIGVSAGLDPWNGPVSSFMYFTRTSSSTKANRGLVIADESILPTSFLTEAIAMPSNHGISWYSANDTISGYIKYLRDDGKNSVRIGVLSDDNTGPRVLTVNFSSLTYGDGISDIGEAGARWRSIYLVNSPDVSSDVTKKTEMAALNSSEMKAAIEIARLPRMFKWISEIQEKQGTDNTVYLHCSPMAQSVWSTFEDNNLDPMNYGFMSDGDESWSIKPQELLWMICAAQQERIDSIESRLSSLEGV